MDTYIRKICRRYCPVSLVSAAILLAIGCATAPVHNQALERARSAYETAMKTPGVESNAPVALYDAKGALEKAEKATGDVREMEHLAYLAERKAQLALLIAEGKASETEISQLSRSKDKILIKAREEESDAARAEAERRAREAEEKAMEADLARRHSEAMMQEAEQARIKAEQALAEKKELEKELADLQAEMTDRGAVVTLGNILFEVNRSRLLQGGLMKIDKLAGFLQKYPKRDLLIEGHTDSRGGDAYNLGLSQQRANSVFSALMERGVDSERMMTKGYGEQYPVAGNDTDAGRQQNRRVEVIILDEGIRPEQKFR